MRIAKAIELDRIADGVERAVTIGVPLKRYAPGAKKGVPPLHTLDAASLDRLDPKQFGRAQWGAVFDLYDRHVAALIGKNDLTEARAALSFESDPTTAARQRAPAPRKAGG